MDRLDIVMITGFRPVELDKCLKSLSLAVAEADLRAQVFIGMNGVLEHQVSALNAMVGNAQKSWREPLVTKWFPREKLGAARNIVLKETRAEWVFFCDDDIEVPLGIFADWRELQRSRSEVEVFGGPNLTPANTAIFDRLQGEVLGTLVGGGPFRRRYSDSSSEGPASSASLTLCNLFVRRPRESANDFLFSSSVRGGEELIFLEKFGRRFYWSPKLFVFHKRRGDFASFYRQCEKYGIGRSHATPIFVCAGLGFLAFCTVLIGFGVAYIFLIYALFVTLNSIRVALKNRERDSVLMVVKIHVAIHAGYFTGLLKGLFPSSREFGSLRE